MSDPLFVAGVMDDYVLVFIDSPQNKARLSEHAKAENENLTKKYGIESYPTALILDGDGNKVGATGYRAGGAYAATEYALESGTNTDYSRCIFGKYYLANVSNKRWKAGNYSGLTRVCVADGSSLYIPYAGKLTELYVGTGAKVDVGDMSPGNNRPFYQVHGEMVVTNLTITGSGDRFFTHGQGTSTPGVFKFEKVTNEMTGNWWRMSDQNKASKLELYIGSGGINFSNSGVCCLGRSDSSDTLTIRPWYGDFVIAGRGDSACVAFAGNVEFNTSDESDTGRTITLNAKTRNEYSGKTVTVSGKGTLQVNNGCSNLAQPSVYVKDYATLAFGENGNLGTGDIQLCRETTLALTQHSGSHAFTKLANKLMLPTESGKVANIRIDGARLDAGTHEIADIKSSGTVAANVALDPYSTSLAGRKASLRVEDGKLYLEVLSTGLMVIIR